MSGAVLMFVDRRVLAAWRVLNRDPLHDDDELRLACSILIECLRHGALVPQGTRDRLLELAMSSRLGVGFQRRLSEALLEIQASAKAQRGAR